MLLIACLLSTIPLPASALDSSEVLQDVDLKDGDIDSNTLRRIRNLNLIVGGGILVWGLAQWDYGTTTFLVKNEGWFGKDTKYGGADKLG
ncbi:MAG: hypothetical protein RRA35_11510, partial [Desulfomonilia bacterium]|nr:hypothetical protein [Desulfomonilia bacterium]